VSLGNFAMKLLLIFPAWCSTFGVLKKVAKKVSSFPPLNLCYVASIAEKSGWEVQVIDAELEELNTGDILKRIYDFEPDLIGLTATTPFFRSVSELAQCIKQHFTIPIILGGAHASLAREQAFLNVFDYLFIGECERHLADFLESFALGKHGEGIPGIMSRENGKIIYYGDSDRIENLDHIPWPARHLIPYKEYYTGTLKGRKNCTSLPMSRGCPFKCVFCASDLYGNKVRRRSVNDVIREIDYVVNELNIPHIYFMDDTLTLDRKYLLALCDEIGKHKLRFTFEGSTRANLWDEELVRRLRECGLIRVSFGLETTDPKVRKIIRKEVPLESYIEANRLNKKYEIETINSVMLGLPGETLESMKKTVDFLCKARDIQHATYGIAMPYPGTEMYRMAQNNQYGLKLLSEDFADYQRYGSAVMEVNGIEPKELVKLQKWGLIRIYFCWWRIWPMLKRHGMRSLIFPSIDALSFVLRFGFSRFFRKTIKNQNCYINTVNGIDKTTEGGKA